MDSENNDLPFSQEVATKSAAERQLTYIMGTKVRVKMGEDGLWQAGLQHGPTFKTLGAGASYTDLVYRVIHNELLRVKAKLGKIKVDDQDVGVIPDKAPSKPE